MFGLFKKQNLVKDISWLGIDIHSHILPGIDDGSKDLQQSMRYINKMEELGFQKLFFTPHIFVELYPNSPETINPVLNKVQNKLLEENNAFPVGAAAEYMVDYNFSVDANLMCLPKNHILIEMSYLSETPNIEQVIFDLQIKGYIVILAHPERYNFYHKSLFRYERLKEMGCLFQLNLLSVVGYYGKAVKQAADHLLARQMYDVAGSDLHHDKHLELLEKCVKNGELYKLIGHYDFKNKLLFE